jgi:hypothetical protein
MKVEHVTPVFEVLGIFIPGALELSLLVATFFSLYYVSRALGFGADLEPSVVAGGAMTFSCFVCVMLNSWDYSGAQLRAEVTDRAPRNRNSAGASHVAKSEEACLLPDHSGNTQFQGEMNPVNGT